MNSANFALASEAAVFDDTLATALARVTERTAIAAARLRGRGDERAADAMAASAMRDALDAMAMRGAIVIGESGDDGEAPPTLHFGKRVGTGNGIDVDVALAPLEGTTICAKNLPNALSVIALAHKGGFLNAPDFYMQKIAVGPGYGAGVVDIDAPARENIENLARAKGVPVGEITACLLDRPRHGRLIEAVRQTGARVVLISGGDVAGIIHTIDPEVTGIDIYLGSGGAPEGVMAAAALRCVGGQMQGRLVLDSLEKLARAEKLGIASASKVYRAEDMARGEVMFAATGVTDGSLLAGVRFSRNDVTTDSIIVRASSPAPRKVKTRHQNDGADKRRESKSP